MFVPTQFWLLNALAQLKGDVGALPLNGLILKLYKNDLSPTVNTVLTDMEEADFSGYAAVPAMDYLDPYVNLAGKAEMDFPSQQFDHSGGGVANSVYGYYIVNGGDNTLLGAERFADGPYPMITAANAITVLHRLVIEGIS